MRPTSYGHIQKLGTIAVLVQSVFLVVFAAAMAGPSIEALLAFLLLGAAYLAVMLYLIGRILRKAETGTLPDSNASRIKKLLVRGAAIAALGTALAIATAPQGGALVLLGLVPQLAMLCIARYRLAS